MIDRRTILLALAGLPAVAARAQTPGASPPSSVIASFSILADLIANVAGPAVPVASLVGPNSDAHAYQPKPGDSRLLAAARLIVVNGLGFEGFIDRLVKASGSKAQIVVASKGIVPLKAKTGADHADAHGHKAHNHDEAADPHAWQSVANAKIYVANIRDGLIGADSAGAEGYRQRAKDYLTRLDALEAEIGAEIARIPPASRRVVSSHDAFGYFERAYGLTFIAARGLSAESEPTAAQIATLIRQVRKEKVKAVFTENVLSPRFAQQLARESGAVVGGTLFSDALSDAKGPAATYIDLMRHNARTLVSALLTS
ncbi:metal ABC transporter substrate-binding protein [Candidatus Raskinella chloraquaticus]|uniref:Metal ABC transporter substrate-binding protein n=1 Tax=Candidatus Raskinella chloraquaticus TaxID=1951219 RepID=A0A1W9HUX5_9HYPH|nr:MAG: metal ABC transporter substrate-binding protein [Proteobacteria bacterium SG_bin8]